ncbi:MAG: gluconate 2-dehydrogenase subunit 3 family protein [Vicinamibacterales bacterium]
MISRRAILRGVGLVSAGAVSAPLPAQRPEPGADGSRLADASPGASPGLDEPFENLAASEGELLEAIVDRLIPSDDLGPGARLARVARYIDRALGGALATARPAYVSGLGALDRYAQSSRGQSFLLLADADKDALLTEVESNTATGFAGGAAPFFAMVLTHTRQGMFSDPYYGGNANFIGWDLLGYPGVRTMVTAAEQKACEAGHLEPNHRSAYDYDTFNKATVRRTTHDLGERAGGD